MRNIIFIILGSIVLWGCSQEKLASVIYLSNPTNINRIDESFVITRQKLGAEKSNLIPTLIDKNDYHIPFQLDDMDGDNNWDELAFVYTLEKGEKSEIQVKWVTTDECPIFPNRTNIRYGKMTSPGHIEELSSDCRSNKDFFSPEDYPYQMDGMAWENDIIGFRHYFDGRNNRDVFGKCVSTMALDTVGIGINGKPANTYQTLADWGRDILNAGESFGLGGLAMISSDTIIQLGDIKTGRKENIDSTYYQLITKGPVRSVFNLKFKGWNIGSHKINLNQQITIWAGQHNYENVVTTDSIPLEFNLITGIVRNQNTQPLVESLIENFHYMITHDKQTTEPKTYMGLALIMSNSNFIESFDIPDGREDITSTWCAKLKTGNNDSPIVFNIYAAWEMQDSKFSNRDYFTQYIESECYKKNNPVYVSIK